MYICERCSKVAGTTGSQRESDESCAVCLGLFHDDNQEFLVKAIHTAIRKAMEPYGRPCENYWSCPSIALPGDLINRFMLLRGKTAVSPSEFAEAAKRKAKDLVSASLCSLTDSQERSSNILPATLNQEESGYLGVHVELIPSRHVVRPSKALSDETHPKRKRRFRQDNQQQGGDPRENLQRRLVAEGLSIWTVNQALSEPAPSMEVEIFTQKVAKALDIYATVWRRPFYVRGTYTKSRRDVSQTPFYTVQNGERKRLGVSSVEEQIAPVVGRWCGGTSLSNNDPTSSTRVFGAIKFHASGREDMDVRMLLPSSHQSTTSATGRPFVCEVIDALRVPTESDLKAMMHEINGTSAEDQSMQDNVVSYYGNHPMGVGVSSLSLVPASAFKNLQSETENKVKHYGCLCWSQAPLLTRMDEIQAQLESFPLVIAQKTPLRVLHRRSLAVRSRRILSCRLVERIDDHYFRLVLSTEAGTYVKEFVHGDLGRTLPSISSLLGCKTDILELDCEGVEMEDNLSNLSPSSTHDK